MYDTDSNADTVPGTPMLGEHHESEHAESADAPKSVGAMPKPSHAPGAQPVEMDPYLMPVEHQ